MHAALNSVATHGHQVASGNRLARGQAGMHCDMCGQACQQDDGAIVFGATISVEPQLNNIEKFMNAMLLCLLRDC